MPEDGQIEPRRRYNDFDGEGGRLPDPNDPNKSSLSWFLPELPVGNFLIITLSFIAGDLVIDFHKFVFVIIYSWFVCFIYFY